MPIIAVYKPKGPTSYDIIRMVKKIAGIKKVGHAGTLDPLAKGVLVIGIGRDGTKNLGNVVKKEKEYLATIKFGVTSTTDDAEGLKIPSIPEGLKIPSIPEGEKSVQQVHLKSTKAEIKKVIKKFQGKILQTPPVFSAIKIKGKEAYKLARQGKEVVLRPREVEVKKIEIISYKWPYLKLRVLTGPGVYIRSLARDIGAKLKVGGYLFNLERTRVGDFTKSKAIKTKKLEQKIKKLIYN